MSIPENSAGKRQTIQEQTMGLKRSRDFILTLSDDDVVESAAESEEEEEVDESVVKKRKMDEDLNPDFEFDGYGVLGGVKGIDDDGWGFSGVTGLKTGPGVDLDGIIERRRVTLAEDEEDEKDDDDDDEDEKDEEEASDDEVGSGGSE